jgi:hypothetical protein
VSQQPLWTLPRIIVERSPHGHWEAWFDGRPQVTFGGDSPGTAVDRLWEAALNNRAMQAESRAEWLTHSWSAWTA